MYGQNIDARVAKAAAKNSTVMAKGCASRRAAAPRNTPKMARTQMTGNTSAQGRRPSGVAASAICNHAPMAQRIRIGTTT